MGYPWRPVTIILAGMRAAIVFALLWPGQISPPPPSPAPAPRPAQPAPAPARRPAAAPARGGMLVTVTNPQGIILPGTHVEVLGTSDRAGDTNANGQLSLVGMQAGTYRVRFSGDAVTTFEREITIRPGQVADVDVVLQPAPPPPPPPPPPPAPEPKAPPPPAVGPAGEPRTVSILDLLDKQFIGNQPRRETLLSCSGNTRTTLVQLNQDQPERLYDMAEVTYYIVGGEGAVRVNGRETAFPTTGFVSIPRGTAHALIRRGKRPLIVIATLSGTPCEEPR